MTALVPGLTELGYKLNFIDLNAAIGRVQLKRQPAFRSIRQAIAQRYVAKLGAPETGIGFQRDLLEARHAKHLFPVMLPIERMSCTRDQLVLKMRERNVGGTIHYAPLHRMPLYQAELQPALRVTEHLVPRIMTLPISASMTLEDADYAIDTVAELLRSNQAMKQPS
jgi:dTDP-4-amino-4,6-dideoxygalactose transaminase